MEPDELAIRAVGRAVVDVDDLPLDAGRVECGLELVVERAERRLLVQERDDDREPRRRRGDAQRLLLGNGLHARLIGLRSGPLEHSLSAIP